jgi:FAD/FMN-containing dehydrogenase
MDDGPTLAEPVEGLREQVQGQVLGPGDDGYDDARRVWNGMVDARPLAVVRASSVEDVRRTVLVARERGLTLAVRGGGHGVAGNGTVDGGIVLDLGALNAVRTDPGARTVTAGGGALLADVDAATAPHGLVVPLGVVSRTGVGGLTLGGGVGWLTRAYGLAADNLLAADVVTATGEVVRAGDDGDPELLWGLRGGGGNFGVAVSLTFRAYPLPERVLAGTLLYGRSRWREVLAAYERWTREMPEAMQTIVSVMTPPPELEAGDDPILMVGYVWALPDHDAGEAVVAELRAVAPPDAEESGPATWRDVQTAQDAFLPPGSRAYWKNASFDRLDDEVIEVLVRRGTEQTWVGTGYDIHHMAGAYEREPEGGSPFPARSARFWLNIYGFWTDPADDAHHTAFVRGLAADMAPFATGGLYVNFMGGSEVADGAAWARTIYGEEATGRLVALKRRYDPENLFRLNHNIPPG